MGLAALGIIISAIFGLRAVARIFYGKQSDELSEYAKDSPIVDLSVTEMIPAGVLVSALLFLGLWPKGISERVNHEIHLRYESSSSLSGRTSQLPPCCLAGKDQEGKESVSPEDSTTLEPKKD